MKIDSPQWQPLVDLLFPLGCTQGDRPEVSRLQQALYCGCVDLVPAVPQPLAQVSQVQEGQEMCGISSHVPLRDVFCSASLQHDVGRVGTVLEMAFSCSRMNRYELAENFALIKDYWGYFWWKTKYIPGCFARTMMTLYPVACHKLSMLKPLHVLFSVLHLVPINKRIVLSLCVKIRSEVDVYI